MIAALRAALRFFDAKPDLARLCLVETVTATPAIATRFREALLTAIPLLEVGRAERSDGFSLPESTEDSLLGGLFILTSRSILADRLPPALLPDLIDFVLSPYLGPEAAKKLAAEAEFASSRPRVACPPPPLDNSPARPNPNFPYSFLCSPPSPTPLGHRARLLGPEERRQGDVGHQRRRLRQALRAAASHLAIDQLIHRPPDRLGGDRRGPGRALIAGRQEGLKPLDRAVAALQRPRRPGEDLDDRQPGEGRVAGEEVDHRLEGAPHRRRPLLRRR